MRNMTVGIEPIIWTAAALLGLVTLAFVGVELLPSFLFHEPRPTHRRDGRSLVTNGRVSCRVQGVDIDVDECVGCPHLRVMDGRGSFIVCDGRAAAAITLEL
jgi:hypothetical protein